MERSRSGQSSDDRVTAEILLKYADDLPRQTLAANVIQTSSAWPVRPPVDAPDES
jgi:hypothetical protein